MSEMAEAFASSFHLRSAFERKVFYITITSVAALSVVSAFLSPLKVLAVILTLISLAIAITRPYLIIVLLALWTPVEPFLLKFVPDELYVYARYFPEALIYVMAALVVVHVLIEQRKLPYNPLNFPFVLFLVALAASAILNLVPFSVAVLGTRQILRYVILFFTVTYLAPPKTRIRQTVLILLGVAALESALGVIQALTGGAIDQFLIPSDRKFFDSIQLTAGVQQFWAPGQRVFATLGRYDQLGTFLAFFMLIASGILYEVSKPEVRRNILIFASVAIPALVLTYSRSSWFGFVLGFLVIGLALKRDKRVALVISLALAAVLSIFFYQRVVLRYLIDVPQQTITERFFEAFSVESIKGEYYGLGRLYWIVNTPLVVVRSSPFFGVGPGMFGGGAAAALHNTAAYNRLGLPFGVYGTDGQIDSNWNSLWGETGTIGLAFYLAMVYTLLRTSYRLFKKSDDPWTRGLALGYFGAVFSVCFQAMLGSYLEVRTLALFFWLTGAFVVILAKREEITV